MGLQLWPGIGSADVIRVAAMEGGEKGENPTSSDPRLSEEGE